MLQAESTTQSAQLGFQPFLDTVKFVLRLPFPLPPIKNLLNNRLQAILRNVGRIAKIDPGVLLEKCKPLGPHLRILGMTNRQDESGDRPLFSIRAKNLRRIHQGAEEQ